MMQHASQIGIAVLFISITTIFPVRAEMKTIQVSGTSGIVGRLNCTISGNYSYFRRGQLRTIEEENISIDPAVAVCNNDGTLSGQAAVISVNKNGIWADTIAVMTPKYCFTFSGNAELCYSVVTRGLGGLPNQNLRQLTCLNIAE